MMNGHINGTSDLKINKMDSRHSVNGKGPSSSFYQNGNAANGLTGNGNYTETNGVNGNNNTDDFVKKIMDLILDECVDKGTSADSKVVEFKHPLELKKCMNFELKDEGASDSELMGLCESTTKYSVKTGHPRFFNQLFSGQNKYGLAGALLTEGLNTSIYTYEVAPVFTVVEQFIIRKLADLIGFDEADGIFCPGGSMANMYGLSLARQNKFPQIKTEGMAAAPKLCILTSTDSHFSIKKGAVFLGFGMDNIRPVKCDERGKMCPVSLEEEITKAKAEGLHPFFVHATSGTTVLGAYDPLEAIADICDKHNMWLHADAAWGGGAIISTKYRHLVKGINRADSVTWNPHKMMGAPLQCCAFVTRHKGLLEQAHSAKASYLFQQDKFYDVSYDTGDKSIQCGRKVDAFKLWLMWKAKGTISFGETMDHLFEMSRFFAERIKTNPAFRMVLPEPECTNVCFWYIPPSLREQEETPEWWQKLKKVAPKIKERMVCDGTMLIGYQPHEDKVNFFRLVICNANVSKEDMLFVITEIDRLGKDL